MPNHPDPDRVVHEARKWIGTKWVHQGRSKAGVDCAGLVLKVAEAVGCDSGDMIGYKRTPNARAFLDHIRSQTELADGPAPGRIAIFRQSAFPCHTGIFSEMHGVTYFIHSFMGGPGCVMEEQFANQWPSRLVEVRKFRIAE